MPLPGKIGVPLLLLAVCLAAASPRAARAARSDDMIFYGWIAAGVGSVPLHTFALATLPTAGTGLSDGDRRFCNAVLLPLAGPAIAGTLLADDHPLNRFVCVGLWGMSLLQTVGLVVAIAGHALDDQRAQRVSARQARRWALLPAPAPGGIGLVGVF